MGQEKEEEMGMGGRSGLIDAIPALYQVQSPGNPLPLAEVYLG